MITLIIATIGFAIPVMFFTAPSTQEFLDKAKKDIENGATWDYVGAQSLDPTAKSIYLQGTEGSEPFILFKLKK